jgi:hypothetical protein
MFKTFTTTKNNIKILDSRVILYFIFIIALSDLFFLLNTNDMFSVSIFFIIGFLTSFFSKNMIVILCMAIFFTNILKYGSKATLEGFDEDFEEGLDKESEEKEGIEDKGNKTKDMNPDTEDKETFGQDKDVVYSDDNEELKNSEKLILHQEKLLKKINKFKPLLDTIQNITKNLEMFKEEK